jgi:hypothetical protein
VDVFDESMGGGAGSAFCPRVDGTTAEADSKIPQTNRIRRPMDSIPSLGTAPVDATARQRKSDLLVQEASRQGDWQHRLLAESARTARTKSVAVHAGGLITDRSETRKGNLPRKRAERSPRQIVSASRPAIVSPSSSGPIANERTSASPRNQVDWRLANWRVRAWIRSMVCVSVARPASMPITSR